MSIVAVALLVCLASTAAPTAAGAVTTPAPLGVFRGGGSSDAIDAYAAWLGAPMQYAVTFIARGDWSTIDDPGATCDTWAASPYTPIMSVPILPSTSYTLVDGAFGRYDDHWRNFGSALVAHGCAYAVLRLGWEFNGAFYPWAAGGRERAFVAYWRRIVSQLRGIRGQHFKFDWNFLAGNTNADVALAYPGDSYVDFIGLDAYDSSTVHTSAEERWTDQLTRKYGLRWHSYFAYMHGKPITFAEWGLVERPDGLGGGDNPYYITHMAWWFAVHKVAYACYFEVDASDADHRLMLGQFPDSAAKFLRNFGDA